MPAPDALISGQSDPLQEEGETLSSKRRCGVRTAGVCVLCVWLSNEVAVMRKLDYVKWQETPGPRWYPLGTSMDAEIIGDKIVLF